MRKIEWMHVILIALILASVLLTNYVAGNTASSVVAMAGVLVAWLIHPPMNGKGERGKAKRTKTG